MKITLDDVAKEAGVSRATVDRVINGRGKVNPTTIERVNRALYSTNYLLKPIENDSHDQTTYNFDFIFPIPHTRFLDFYSRQIEALKDSYTASQVNVRIHRVPAFQADDLAQKLLEVGKDTDGVSFVALEHPLVKQAVDTLVEKEIGVISFVSDITGTNRLSYVGIDNRAAGRTAGLLLGRFLEKNQIGKVALFIGSHAYRGHEERESGFRSMIREKYPNLTVIEMPELLDNDERAFEIALSSLEAEPEIVAIYNVGGGTEGIVQALKQLNKADSMMFVAHELFDNTRIHLLDGTIDAIINQDIKHEVYNAVEVLLSHKKGRNINNGILKPKVEIFLAENMS
ncbi:LacI family DNA-binding transcriptional regulator [Algibacillus agarilyticus]|uniref:LacI family DNA-binding transcriptional regulator n=1 Tax=Algibacillus agarilyticus TaxID=2234133 RepID=UPI000DCFD943|nr:LacI family DNA-binding transcriptional regulator [Algibacillus agarilyticus]